MWVRLSFWVANHQRRLEFKKERKDWRILRLVTPLPFREFKRRRGFQDLRRQILRPAWFSIFSISLGKGRVQTSFWMKSFYQFQVYLSAKNNTTSKSKFLSKLLQGVDRELYSSKGWETIIEESHNNAIKVFAKFLFFFLDDLKYFPLGWLPFSFLLASYEDVMDGRAYERDLSQIW